MEIKNMLSLPKNLKLNVLVLNTLDYLKYDIIFLIYILKIIKGNMGLQLINTETYNTFFNLGDMLECSFINSKFNYYSEDKKIEFHLINYSENTYVNLGDLVEANDVNEIINNN
jgi:hypothetical protein